MYMVVVESGFLEVLRVWLYGVDCLICVGYKARDLLLSNRVWYNVSKVGL
jgi:hypothetical protein